MVSNHLLILGLIKIIDTIMHKSSSFWTSLLTLLIFFFLSSVSAQDTTWVQGFDYKSKTRDSLIQFPNEDHTQYEKILMYYNMRCKGGLISTGADRNRGCGEWDYSCNTSIIDSTGLDSLKALHPDYIISGISDDFFGYTSQPTYTYTDYGVQNISSTGSSSTTRIRVGSPQGDLTISNKDNPSIKTFFLYRAGEMSGLTSGSISGISFKNKSNGKISFLKLKLASTLQSELTESLISSLSFTEVVNRNVEFNASGETEVYFHRTFNYNQNSNIVMELSYSGSVEDIQELEVLGTAMAENVGFGVKETDRYLNLGTQGSGVLSNDGFKDIRSQITVAFWSNGNSDVLPNNNSVFQATGSNNQRQLNVHLPWGNSRVFWDCGGDASGYDRIDKATVATEYKDQWNHWAFTKNTGSGVMRIYLNGKLWHSGTGKTKPIQIDNFVLGGSVNDALPYFGFIDDFTVWDKELSAQDIEMIMTQNPQSITHLESHLKAYYDMNNDGEFVIIDKSVYNGTCVFKNRINRKTFRGNEIFKNFETIQARPDISWIQGNPNITVTNAIRRDSVLNSPYSIRPFSVVNNRLVEGATLYYWASGYFDVYDEFGNVIDEIFIPDEEVISISELQYYTYSPSKYELMSFVTPYGIGIDFGLEGRTWIFDVTDFGPVLKGQKRLVMDRGGQWQEEMDIRFAFIKGTPTRPVLSIQQVWPVESYGFETIINDRHLEPRELNIESGVESIKIRTVATGHGQQGEFIPRMHSLNVNGGNVEFSWQLWTECSDNPIYPQGGTWIYDRAGWCPGAPSDLREFEIMSLVRGQNTFYLDYGLNTATGDSRYIVNTQLVKYGETNFSNDAAIEYIESPSTYVVYGRINPACANPVIGLKNNGKNNITSAVIQYGLEGGYSNTYNWTGNLAFLNTQKITLPSLPLEEYIKGKKFFANIVSINNGNDEYVNNNYLSSVIAPVNHMDGGIIVSMQTNGMPNETSWTLKDSDGNIIKSSKTGLLPFTTYNDTITNLVGCYELQFTDSDQDGIAWWANGDGNGFIRAKEINGSWITFQPDFGMELTFNFVSGITVSTHDSDAAQSINIYPNPAIEEAKIELTGFYGVTQIELISQTGLLINTETLNNNGSEVLSTYRDLSPLPAGVYFIRVINKSFIQTLKLIKI